MTTLDYLMKVGSVTSALSSLLATDFSNHRFEGLPHSRRVNELVANWFLGDKTSAWQELYLLEYFAKHLKEIERARPDVLQVFRREFRRARVEAQFFGLRFEAYIAASLSRKGVSFVKAESPDFRLADISCSIECTTTRMVDGGASDDLSYKVASAIRKKAASASHRNDCVLFIDITNILHTSLVATASSVRGETRLALEDTEFGCAVLFAHIFNSDNGQLQTVYYREDNSSLTGAPLAFLDMHYWVTENRSYEFSFPPGG